ncbi:MAG: hypothetical protein ACYTE8_00650 [Planctomycetota bacterium]|jgi:hypothetical protein
MSEFDENHIKRHLQDLSQLEPTPQAAQRAIQNTRKALLVNEEIEQGQKSVIFHALIKNPFTKFAAAAVIIITAGLLIFCMLPRKQQTSETISQAEKSPAELLTLASLKMAHSQGGLQALEKQCEKALKLLGPRPKSLSITQLLEELNRNGNNSERNKL